MQRERRERKIELGFAEEKLRRRKGKKGGLVERKEGCEKMMRVCSGQEGDKGKACCLKGIKGEKNRVR